ncbi:Beta-glucuronidase [Penicillium brevicompactum]
MTVLQVVPVTSLKYGRRQHAGQVLQQWLEASTNAPNCHIQHSNIDMSQLNAFQRVDLALNTEPMDLVQIDTYLDSVETGGPKNGGWHKYWLEHLDPTVDDPFDPEFESDDPEAWKTNCWQGQTGPGVIVIEEIKRKTGPFSSQISQVLYEEHFSMDTLKFVYMVDVKNEDTLQFVKTQLYTKSNGVLEQHGDITERYEWDYGTPEFDGLLGTTLGKHVAYLLLGAFNRGTRRIGRVRTWFAFQELQMEFMIEDIQATNYLPPPVDYTKADQTWFGVVEEVLQCPELPNLNQSMPTIQENAEFYTQPDQSFIQSDQFLVHPDPFLAQPNHFLTQPDQYSPQDQFEGFSHSPDRFLPPPNQFMAQHSGGGY